MYQGLKAHNSTEKASENDIIPIGGLAPDIHVTGIINTMHEILCYRY